MQQRPALLARAPVVCGGDGGNRTPVQKARPQTSTSVVYRLYLASAPHARQSGRMASQFILGVTPLAQVTQRSSLLMLAPSHRNDDGRTRYPLVRQRARAEAAQFVCCQLMALPF